MTSPLLSIFKGDITKLSVDVIVRCLLFSPSEIRLIFISRLTLPTGLCWEEEVWTVRSIGLQEVSSSKNAEC